MADGLSEDPKGQAGHPGLKKYFPKQKSASLRASLALSQFGLDPVEQKMLAVEQKAGEDSQPVQNYIMFMAQPLHDWQGNPTELARIGRNIQDFAAQAQVDVLLNKAEKVRVATYARDLLTLISKKTSLVARAQTQFKAVVKVARTSTASALSGTSSIIGKIAGSLLAPKAASETAEKDILKARVQATEHMAKMEEKARRVPGEGLSSFGVEDEDEGIPPARVPKPKKTPKREAATTPVAAPTTAPKKFKTIPETGGSGTLEDILSTDRDILSTDQKILKADTGVHTRLDKIVALLINAKESTEQQAEAAERTADTGPARMGPTATSPVKEKTAVKSGSLFGDIGGMLKNLIGGFDLGKMLGPMLLPAVSALGSGLMVVAAGFAGWELGKWLDKLSGGRLSGGVQKMADWMLNTGDRKTSGAGSNLEGAKQDSIRLAQQRSGGKVHAKTEDWTYEEAVKFNSTWKPTFNKPTAPASPTPTTETPATPAAVAAPAPNAPETAPAAPPVALGTPAGPLPTSPLKVPVAQMHVSEEGVAKLKTREGIRKEPYWDVNGWAIGFGDHEYNGVPLGTDHSKKPNVRLTDAEANTAIRRRLATHYEPIVRKNLGTKSVTQNEFDALVSVAYNSEAAAARLSRRTAAGETLKKEDFLASGTVGGHRVAELQARRAGEFEQFTSGSRAAGPVVTLTAANESGRGDTTIIQAPMVSGGGRSGSGSPVIYPQAIAVNNPDPTVSAIRSANVT